MVMKRYLIIILSMGVGFGDCNAMERKKDLLEIVSPRGKRTRSACIPRRLRKNSSKENLGEDRLIPELVALKQQVDNLTRDLNNLVTSKEKEGLETRRDILECKNRLTIFEKNQIIIHNSLKVLLTSATFHTQRIGFLEQYTYKELADFMSSLDVSDPGFMPETPSGSSEGEGSLFHSAKSLSSSSIPCYSDSFFDRSQSGASDGDESDEDGSKVKELEEEWDNYDKKSSL